ncbi:MAG: hypothetical protein J0G94_02685 [Sphingomonadales bacterium]|nr:hypothetical protein [Sphingomonadales bacterium]
MKLSRRDPYRSQRPRRHPLFWLGPLILVLFVGLLVLAWSSGGEQPVREIEVPVPANALGG